MNDDDQDARSHLLEMLHGFDSGMLATRVTSDGTLRGRPMGVAEVTDAAQMYFSANITSPKVAEIAADARVAVLFQGKTQWISVTGIATVVRDRALIDRLWRDSWKLWFPEGKNDPNLCLIRVDSTEAEYWDNSGTRGVRFAFETLKAAFQGKAVEAERPEQNAKVSL